MLVFISRSSQWWDYVATETFTPHDWMNNFRMSKETFVYLCEQLRPTVYRQDTRLRKAIPVEKRVAIALWCLATPAEYRTIGHLFGVARSTVCIIVHSVVDAIVNVLLRQYIQFPTGEQLTNVINGFESTWNFPQCAGGIDGCHIPVQAPLMNHTDYYNRKGWYSIILQAVVDHRYIFRDVYCGWPGCVHDSRVLANSTLYERATDGQILNGEMRQLSGVDVPVMLVGDSGYPLTTWLMKPYTFSGNLTPEQKHFNYRLSRARIVTENAFGRLKARWRRLLKQNDMDIQNATKVVVACCILHNVCEIHGDSFDEQWLEDSQAGELRDLPGNASHQDDNMDAECIRDALVKYLKDN